MPLCQATTAPERKMEQGTPSNARLMSNGQQVQQRALRVDENFVVSTEEQPQSGQARVGPGILHLLDEDEDACQLSCYGCSGMTRSDNCENPARYTHI